MLGVGETTIKIGKGDKFCTYIYFINVFKFPLYQKIDK